MKKIKILKMILVKTSLVAFFSITALHTVYADNIIDETLACRGTEPFWALTLDTSYWQDGPYAKPGRAIHAARFSQFGSEEILEYNSSEIRAETSTNDSSIFGIYTSPKNGRVDDAIGSAKAKPQLHAFLDLRDSQETKCNDGMSEHIYPYSIYIRINSRVYSGCCDSSLLPAKLPK